MPAVKVEKPPKLCMVPDCGRKALALMMCAAHYRRFREGRELDSPIEARSMDQVQISSLRLLREDAEYLFQHAEKTGQSPYEVSRSIVELWIENRRKKGLRPGETR